MKKFFIGLLKGIGYFGIYFGMQLLVTMVYAIVGVVPVAMKYYTSEENVFAPDVFNRYMEEVLQVVMEAALPSVWTTTSAVRAGSMALKVSLLWAAPAPPQAPDS